MTRRAAKRGLTGLLAALCAGALSIHAQTDVAPSLSITATPAYVSQYMFRGQRLGGQAFEPSVEADYGDWALGVWSNFPIANKVPGQSDPEIDPYGSYTFNVSDSFSVVPGFTVYTYAKAPTDQGFYRSTFEPSIAANTTYEGLKFTPKIYYDVVLRTLTSELSVGYAVPVKELGSELDFAGTIGDYLSHDAVNEASPRVKAYGNYWLLGVSAPYQLTRAAKISFGWAYTKGTDSYFKQGTQPGVTNSEAVGRGVFSTSLAYTF